MFLLLLVHRICLFQFVIFYNKVDLDLLEILVLHFYH